MQIVYAMEQHLPIIEQIVIGELGQNHKLQACSVQNVAKQYRYSRQEIKANILDFGHTYLLAFVNDCCVGFIHVDTGNSNNNIINVYTIALLPSYESSNIKKLLVDAVIKETCCANSHCICHASNENKREFAINVRHKNVAYRIDNWLCQQNQLKN